jgi:hypothetical protein
VEGADPGCSLASMKCHGGACSWSLNRRWRGLGRGWSGLDNLLHLESSSLGWNSSTLLRS